MDKVKFLEKIKARDYFGIEDEIEEIVKNNAKIISVGGNHSITLPILRAFSQFFRNVEILHFDAHLTLTKNMKITLILMPAHLQGSWKKGLLER